MNWFHYASIDVLLFFVFSSIALVVLTILIFRLPRYLLDKSKEKEHGAGGHDSSAHKESVHEEQAHQEPVHEGPKDKHI
jgi:flagellar biosynthesis/type III secretory pathway M-ring protein FliF/YscJ